MKRIFICMVILTIFTGCLAAGAEASSIFVDGKAAADYETVTLENETLYPFRLITESLGASVTWLGDYRAAVVRYKGCGYWCYTKDGNFYVQKYDFDGNRGKDELLTVIEGRGEIIDDRIYIEEDTLVKMLELFGCEFDKEAKSVKGTSEPFNRIIERGEQREKAREIHTDMFNNHREELESVASEMMAIAEKNGGTVHIARNARWDHLESYLFREDSRQAISFSLTDEETAALNKFFAVCDSDKEVSVSANYREGWVSVMLCDYNFIAEMEWCRADSMVNLNLYSVYVEELGDGWAYCESVEMECGTW